MSALKGTKYSLNPVLPKSILFCCSSVKVLFQDISQKYGIESDQPIKNGISRAKANPNTKDINVNKPPNIAPTP